VEFWYEYYAVKWTTINPLQYFRSLPEEDADRALMTMSPFEPARQQQQAELQEQQQEQQQSPMESDANVSSLSVVVCTTNL
jgi:hypothetical protein